MPCNSNGKELQQKKNKTKQKTLSQTQKYSDDGKQMYCCALGSQSPGRVDGLIGTRCATRIARMDMFRLSRI